jgi:hypothetical protein
MKTLYANVLVLGLVSVCMCPSLLAKDLREFNELTRGSSMQEVQQAVGPANKEVQPQTFGAGIEWWYFGIQGYPDNQNRFSVMLLFHESTKKLLGVRIDRQ